MMQSLHKLRHLYWNHKKWYQKHHNCLSTEEKTEMETALSGMRNALQNKERKNANQWAQRLEERSPDHKNKKSLFFKMIEFVFALTFALAAALVIRQMWFELYQIPTGSMRPTFRELDRLVVSKTNLGLNIPSKPGHFVFNPDNVKRGGIVIWKGDGMKDLSLEDRFLGIIPYNRRFVKRLIGKPGDTLYFYGGKIWGIDKEGKPINDLQKQNWNQGLEHIPFSHFSGTARYSKSRGIHKIILEHFGKPLAKITADPYGEIRTSIYHQGKWIEEDSSPLLYNEHFGIDQFGKARILTVSQAKAMGVDDEYTPDAYLQISHHPHLSNPLPAFYPYSHQYARVWLHPEISYLPLYKQQLQNIRNGLYTSRFVVKNGKAFVYDGGASTTKPYAVPFSKVPDGTYEFYYGKGYQVRWDGHLTPLAEDHPLQPTTTDQLIALFNLGLEFNTHFIPSSEEDDLYPNRYAYWNQGTLFLAGTPIANLKTTPSLQIFVLREKEKEQQLPSYQPFIDTKIPLKENGALDIDLIKKYGLTVPEKHYLLLGDNHARSKDSRMVGFVPEENLEGTPSFTLWPRWERPVQAFYHWITLPRMIVWTIALILFFGWRWFLQREVEKPL